MEFRRYRADQLPRRDTRSGFGLELTFCEPVRSPLVVGQVSHFGFGVFVPLDGAPTP